MALARLQTTWEIICSFESGILKFWARPILGAEQGLKDRLLGNQVFGYPVANVRPATKDGAER
jgi:hypothetical protein